MRHVDYQEWADEVFGDRRQVYARDIRKAPDDPLTFMGPGEASRFYADARADLLVCPVPGCPSPKLTTRGPAERRHHFVHRQAPGGTRHGRAYTRRVTVRLLREWLDAQSTHFQISEDADVSGVRVTLLVRSPRTGRRVALIYVDGRYGVDAWEEDYERLKAADVPTSWIFALRRMFFSLPQPRPGVGPDDPVARDRGRADLVLDKALYREMRRGGLWPLLISLERRELANLITPMGRLAGPLGLQPPESGDRVLHLVPSPLADARLTRYGVATRAVPENLLQRAWQAQPPPRAQAPPPSRPEHRLNDLPPHSPVPIRGTRPEVTSPSVLELRSVASEAPERRWKRARSTLHKQLADTGLAEELSKPLPTDVECDLLTVHWHTLIAVWLRRRPALARNPSELRRRLSDAGAGARLTTSAVEGFLSWWDERRSSPLG
jgi:hypothetical protein